jgi:thiol-disulfide isomerase/thioredoxin
MSIKNINQYKLLIALFAGITFCCCLSIYAENNAITPITKKQEVSYFQLKLLGNSETLDKRKLLGKVYLLDFWMTSCHPCQDKMPFLHNVYKKYQGKNFLIISISFDKDREAVETFRKGQWEMPWLHCLAFENTEYEIRRLFDVCYLPKLILIDQYGKIICIDSEIGINKALEEIYE